MTRHVFALTVAATLCGATAVDAQAAAPPATPADATSHHALLVAPQTAGPAFLADDAAPRPLLPSAALQDRRATVPGLVIGGLVGVAAGLIFVHTACNEDPCIDAAYLLGAAVGAAVFGGIGALIGSQVSR